VIHIGSVIKDVDKLSIGRCGKIGIMAPT